MGTGKDEESDCRLDWCDAGYLYVDETNACVPCGIGFYRTDHDMECIRCPNGLTTLTPTATSAAACTAAACGKGNFINVASQTCLPCPEDTYNDKENQLKCIDCVPPKHTMGTGKDEESDCRLDWCDAGYLYVDETNACVPCGIGFYRTDHDMECIRCPNGLTTLTPTATSAAACTGSGAVNAFGLTMDLLVVTDLSASTTSAGLASVRTFLSEMVSRMSVNNRYTHVGNMAYARGVSTLMTLESGQFPDRVLRSLNSGFRISPFREVNTGFALHQACKVFTSYCRRHVEKRLLLITDEISSDTGLSRIQSEKLKAKGVRIIVIGSDVTEANQLASGPQYVFKINSYTNMPSLDAVLVAFK
ncbi:hypothetical protein DPMN_024370 [Dreissena polymorpha]|uniref:VWFA domain-containing protein n=2 Tax=Dreissena polymorpha TaxID=45954 RepID=A0A9D4LP09_DREPO|nr:hypothetical protein DPMN_024370 [Dreissena polymorpha]